MSLFDKLRIAATVILGGKNVKRFPSLVFCPVCHRRTRWIEQGRLWGCDEGHRFSVNYHSSEPMSRIPGDDGDNSKGEI